MHCEVPEVELEDGSSSTVLTVTFPSGQTVKPCCVDSSSDDPCIIPCKITFQSASPVSFSTVVTFVAGKDRFVYFYLFINKFANSRSRGWQLKGWQINRQ